MSPPCVSLTFHALPLPRALLARRSHPRTGRSHPIMTISPSPTPSPTPSPSPSPSPPPSLFTDRSKWTVAICAATVHSLHAAAVYIAPATLLTPIRLSLSLTVPQVTLPLTAYRLIQALFLIPSGHLLDRFGPHRCLTVSISSAALLLPLFPLITTFQHFLLLQSLLSLTKLTGGLSAILLLLTRAFSNTPHLSTATAILLSGYSFAAAATPFLIGLIHQAWGWRRALGLVSFVFAVFAPLLTFLTLRHSPPPIPTPRRPAPYLTRQPLLTAPFLHLLVAVAAMSFSMHIILDHLLLYLADLQYPFANATFLLSLFNMIVMLSKLAIGPLADRYPKSLLISLFSLLALCASSLLLTSLPFKVLAFIPVYALAYAAVFTLTTASLPEFGTHRLGLRSNLNLVVLFAFGALGSSVAASLRAATGSYYWPFVLNSSVWVVAAAVAWRKYILFDCYNSRGDKS